MFDTLLMSFGLRAQRPHVCRLQALPASANQNHQQPGSFMTPSSSGQGGLGGTGIGTGLYAKNLANKVISNHGGAGGSGGGWGGIRFTCGVTKQRLRTIVIEILSSNPFNPLSPSLPNQGFSSFNDIGGDIITVLREALEYFVQKPSNSVKSRGGSGGGINFGLGVMSGGKLKSASSGGSVGVGSISHQEEEEEEESNIDPLYVLQLRSTFLSELSDNLISFEGPLFDWIKKEENLAKHLTSMLLPYFQRFMPDTPCPQPPFQQENQTRSNELNRAWFPKENNSLLNDQNALFNAKNAKDARVISAMRKNESNFGTAKPSIVNSATSNTSNNSSERANMLDQDGNAVTGSKIPVSCADSGVGCGWEFATDLAIKQANQLIEDAKVRVISQWEDEKKKVIYDLSNRDEESVLSSEKVISRLLADIDKVVRSLWSLFTSRCEEEANIYVLNARAEAALRLKASETYRYELLTKLAARSLPTMAMLNNAASNLDASERAFHKRFRVADEALLFECACSLKSEQQSSSNDVLIPGLSAEPSGGGGGNGGGNSNMVLRREVGRLYVTFSHLWFHAPGGLLKNESQVVLPFYTVGKLWVNEVRMRV
jgi:hypothetical protein